MRSEGFLKGGDETIISEGTEKWGMKYGEVQQSEVKWNS